jgi:hypothetical protein
MKDPIDRDAAERVAHLQFTSGVLKNYGRPGTLALRKLTRAIRAIHDALAYELISDGLTVFVPLNGEQQLSEGVRTDSAQLPSLVKGAATIEVIDVDEYVLQPSYSDPRVFADAAVVYHFGGVDQFVIDGEPQEVENQTSYPSVFGLPTFYDLADALKDYRDNRALHSQCPILSQCWHDEKRWLLNDSPEHIMRDSLHDFLKQTLRGHKYIDIRPEQPVDTGHIPDIKVTWTVTNRVAYIEIKWLGKSVSADGNIARHSEGRARKGAGQLAVYLAKDEEAAPRQQRVGYLAIFDARRWGVSLETTALDAKNGLRYQASDISYNPDFAQIRHDFEQPLRFFLAPCLTTLDCS